MTRPKYTKPDKNQAQIVKDLRSLGFDVDIICDLPGLYDLVVSGQKYPHTIGGKGFYRCDCSVRVEVKSDGGQMYDSELRYYKRQKHKESYMVATCTQDILNWFGDQR
jgi:hypothetical protein